MMALLAALVLFAFMASAAGTAAADSSAKPALTPSEGDKHRAAVEAFARLYPSLGPLVKAGTKPSIVVEALQQKLGLNPDGYLGKDTRYMLTQYGFTP